RYILYHVINVRQAPRSNLFPYTTLFRSLEFAEDPKDWVTLWPRTNRPPVSVAGRQLTVQDEDGLWPMWTGEALRKRRASMSPKKDRKSTRLNSSHVKISYAVFCLKKKKD